MRSALGFLTAITVGALVAASSIAGPPPQGHLVLIGGGDKPADAMARFIELAGGPQAPMVAIPTASTDSDVGHYYTDLFREEYGCPNMVTLDIKSRADAMRPDWAELAAAAGGIFFGGGDQALITRAILGTAVGDAIAAAFARGAVVGGTSAGTACQSPLMITGEGDFTVIRAGWSLGIRCGDKNIIMAESTLTDAERRARWREFELRKLHDPDMPPCVRLVTVDPTGTIVAPQEGKPRGG